MNCPACGADNRQEANFCRMCGAKLSEPAVTAVPEDDGSGILPDELEPEAEASAASPKEAISEVDSGEAMPAEVMPDPGAQEIQPEEPVPAADAELEEDESEGVREEDIDVTGELAPAGKPRPVSDSEVPEVSQPETERPSQQGPSIPSQVEEPALSGIERPMPSKDEGAEVVTLESVSELAETETVDEKEVESEVEERAVEVEEEPGSPGPIGLEPLVPVAPETVIDGRYEVVAVLDAEENELLYLAHDLCRCWQCGFEGNEPSDSYCAECGVSLDHKVQVRLLEVQGAEVEAVSEEMVAGRLSHKERHFLLLAEPALDEEPEGERGAVAPEVPTSIRLVVGYSSDAGQVRELDEDSLLALTLAPTYESQTAPVLGLFAVADGMGGHEGGEIASKLALQVLTDDLIRSVILPELAEEHLAEDEIVARMRQATLKANDAVYLARKKRANDMGTTLTTVLVRDDQLLLAHVGDCRAYRWNAGGLQQLTTDHSLVASMIAGGQATPDEIYTHPHRSVIYRSIGDQPVVEVDTDVLSLACGDRIIVCCDGLWEMVRDEGIEDVMLREADPQAASELLVNHANVAGGDDNISVIVVQVEAV